MDRHASFRGWRVLGLDPTRDRPVVLQDNQAGKLRKHKCPGCEIKAAGTEGRLSTSAFPLNALCVECRLGTPPWAAADARTRWQNTFSAEPNWLRLVHEAFDSRPNGSTLTLTEIYSLIERKYPSLISNTLLPSRVHELLISKRSFKLDGPANGKTAQGWLRVDSHAARPAVQSHPDKQMDVIDLTGSPPLPSRAPSHFQDQHQAVNTLSIGPVTTSTPNLLRKSTSEGNEFEDHAFRVRWLHGILGNKNNFWMTNSNDFVTEYAYHNSVDQALAAARIQRFHAYSHHRYRKTLRKGPDFGRRRVIPSPILPSQARFLAKHNSVLTLKPHVQLRVIQELNIHLDYCCWVLTNGELAIFDTVTGTLHDYVPVVGDSLCSPAVGSTDTIVAPRDRRNMLASMYKRIFADTHPHDMRRIERDITQRVWKRLKRQLLAFGRPCDDDILRTVFKAHTERSNTPMTTQQPPFPFKRATPT